MNYRIAIVLSCLVLCACSREEGFYTNPAPGVLPPISQTVPPEAPAEIVTLGSKKIVTFKAVYEPRMDSGDPQVNVVFLTDDSGSMIPYQTKLASSIERVFESAPQVQMEVRSYSSTLFKKIANHITLSNGELYGFGIDAMNYGNSGANGVINQEIALVKDSGNRDIPWTLGAPELPYAKIQLLMNNSLFKTSDGVLRLGPTTTASELATLKLKFTEGVLAGNKGSSNEQMLCNLLHLVFQEGTNTAFVKDRGAIIVATTDANPFSAATIYNCPKSFGYKFKMNPNVSLRSSIYWQVIRKPTLKFCEDGVSQSCADEIKIVYSQCLSGNCDDVSKLNQNRSCNAAEIAAIDAELAKKNALEPVGKKTVYNPGGTCSSVLTTGNLTNNFAPPVVASCQSVTEIGVTSTFDAWLQKKYPNTKHVPNSCVSATMTFAGVGLEKEYYPGLSATSTADQIIAVIRAKLAEITGVKGYALFGIGNHPLVNPPGAVSTEAYSEMFPTLLGSALSNQSLFSVFEPDYSMVKTAYEKFIQWQLKSTYAMPDEFKDLKDPVAKAVLEDDTVIDLQNLVDYKIVSGKFYLIGSSQSLNIKTIKVEATIPD